VPSPAKGRQATYLEVSRSLEEKARSGLYPPGSRLSPQRDLEDGTAQTILEAQRTELQARQALARELLPAEHLHSDPACMFVWLRVPPPWRSDDFAANAFARGVNTMPASAFAVDRSTVEHGVRINLACAATNSERCLDRWALGKEIPNQM
jgi:DNA-binding transcriptional MocR family regulator